MNEITYSLEERKKWVSRFPYVAQLDWSRRCDAHVGGRHGNPFCSKKAWWSYMFVWANTPLNYCWLHLSTNGINGTEGDHNRFQEWCRKEGYPEKLLEER